MKELQKKLNYSFNDKELIVTALTHSSYANEHRCQSNERLEFIGDSVLGMVVAMHLYRTFPNLPEGKMTRMRAELVCEQSLWEVADKLEFGKYLRLGKGEALTGGRERPSILADCVEAVIAALYIDGGFEVAKKFVDDHILPKLENLGTTAGGDYKTRLQELVQRFHGQSLSYEMLSESGPDHMKVFCAAVYLNGEMIGQGQGRTKKEAEQNAASKALEELKDE
ncbi:MAG: ribonuclease III [Ruminococcaceae bacterium]|nr:ribonuclease III [Oscillospiraceae bacterium]